MSELKPCPFCAGKITVVGKNDVYDYKCENGCIEGTLIGTLEQVVEQLNSRPIEDALQQKYDLLLAGVKAAMEEIHLEHTNANHYSPAAVFDKVIAIIRKHIKEVKRDSR